MIDNCIMKRIDFIYWGILNLVAGMVAYPILTYPLGRDQGEFATIASMMINGRVLYTDAWNPKPPAIFFVYRGVIELFGTTTEAIRSIDFLIFPLISLALYWLALQIANRRVAILSIVIFIALYFTESFWTLSQNDGVAMLPMILLFCGGVLSLRENKLHFIWALLAGLCGGILIWFKYPFAVMIGITLLASLPYHRHKQQMIRNIIAFGIGGLIPLLLGYYFFVQAGAWDTFIESARVTSEYASLSYDINFILNDVSWEQARQDRWLQWGAPLIVIFVGLFNKLVLNRNTTNSSRERRSLWWLVLAWLMGAFLAMLVQAKGYDYHWLPMLPPLVLITSYFVDSIIVGIISRIRRVNEHQSLFANRVIVGISILLLITAAVELWVPAWDFIRGEEDKLTYYQDFRGGEFVADESKQVIDYLNERTVDGDTLYIWGFRAEVYYLTNLRPATRFIFQFPLVAEWYPEAWRQENVDVLWASLPPYVLVMQGDYMPWVTDRDEDSNELLQEYTALNDWLIFNYEYDTTIGNFNVWRRRDYQ